jgi:alkylresorcinol/alkylpyrone synthase
MPFRHDVERLPVFGLGCAGGVLGLGRAAALARAVPGRRVLMLTVELCALTFRPGDTGKSNVIAAALFGDGAAGAVLSTHAGDSGPVLADWGEHTWPDTLDVMGWRVEDDGLGVLFAQAIPGLVQSRYGEALDGFLARNGMARADVAGHACHPGGAKVVAAMEDVFGLPAGGMRAARDVLWDFGNMSAPTVLFVLDRLLRGGLPGPTLATALGPGFSAGFALFERDGAQ